MRLTRCKYRARHIAFLLDPAEARELSKEFFAIWDADYTDSLISAKKYIVRVRINGKASYMVIDAGRGGFETDRLIAKGLTNLKAALVLLRIKS